MRKIYFLLFVGFAASFFGCKEQTKEIFLEGVIPQPNKVYIDDGVLVLEEALRIGYGGDESIRRLADYLYLSMKKRVSFPLAISDEGAIQLSLDYTMKKPGAYRLDVENRGVKIVGSDYEGLSSGIATFLQLLPFNSSEIKLQQLHIEDFPRFSWRGLMLDSSRHFWTVEEVKKILDLMAYYKLNKFHWHLTDDQGWRVEIKRYPLLTEKGGWRKLNWHDRDCMARAKAQNNPDFELPQDRLRIEEGELLYGGFYTQEQLREVVDYASMRGIDVIPEIDMPGHFLAAMENYPDIACSRSIGWGKVFSSPICPGKDNVLEFCKNIYKEVFELFPYEYVHLGADEVDKTNWKVCPDCQRRIKEQELEDEEQLQAWFVHEMEQFFNENGRKLIGWDEIIEGGLSETSTIMWWRSWHPQSVPDATAHGNEVIISPNAVLYFDALQDKNSLRKVIEFDPVPDTLSLEQKQLIKGVQANLWTEWVPSMKRIEYMLFPRILGLSEIAWVQPEKKNADEFYKRITKHFIQLEGMELNYRIPDLEGFYDVNVFTDSILVDVRSLIPNVDIRYTTDGTMPTLTSDKYTHSFMLYDSVDFIFRTFRADGSPSDAFKTSYRKETFMPGIDMDNLEQGVKISWYDYPGEVCGEVDQAPLLGVFKETKVCIPKGTKNNIGLVVEGYLDVPDDAIYTFALNSDDGSMLYLDERLIINNDKPHAPIERIAQVALAQGLHRLRIEYFDQNGGMLDFYCYDLENRRKAIPESWFKRVIEP